MSLKTLYNNTKRGVNELKTLTSFERCIHLTKRTAHSLICELLELIVTRNTFSLHNKHPRILYVDNTGRDGRGIGDDIFTLPMLQSLGSVAHIDILTTKTRKVIYDNQIYINEIFTALEQPCAHYDHILLLRRSFRKFHFIFKKFGLIGFTQKTLLSTYSNRFIEDKHLNHIELAHKGVQDVIPILPDLTDFRPHIQLTDYIKAFGRSYVQQYGSENNIAIAVGNKDPRRDYKALHHTISLLAQTYPTYTFFLVGDESGLRQESQIGQRKNIVYCSGKFTLEQSFGIISATQAAVGFDSGLANAAIALDVPTYVIYNIVYPEERVPQDATHVTTLDIGCDEKCYYTTSPHICHKTTSSTPDCLETYSPFDLYNNITSWIDELGNEAHQLQKKRTHEAL